MQIANAIADYDYYKNSRADTAAITARERKKTETRPRRYVAARLVGCLSVSSPLSPPPLGFSLRLLVVSFMSSAFLLRRHLAFCQLASFLISLCHQFFVLSCCFFEPPPAPMLIPGRIFIAALLSPLFLLLQYLSLVMQNQ